MAASVTWGQGTFASITGAVRDSTNAVIPGAIVEATQVERNYTYTATTNQAGIYTLANLIEGTYTVVVRAAGFQRHVAGNIILRPNDLRRVDATMQLGEVTTTIEVTGGAALIETETARISDVKNREVLRAMPLTLRRAWDYFTMTPQFERTSGWGLRLAGVQNQQADATLDGTTLAGAGGSTPIGPLMDRTELVQEMRVDIAQANAEFATMGQLSLVSRSGTNKLHGTGALYYNNNDWNSRNPFSLTKNKGEGYQWIAGVGGPVHIPRIYDGRNKTFFFYNLEIATGPVSPFTVQRVAPLNRWREGDFSTAGTVIRNPLAGNQPFPGNRIPTTQINAAARKYQEMFIPKQNHGDLDRISAPNPTYVRTYSGFPFVHQPTISYRLDHRISDKQFVYGRLTTVRWNWDRPETIFPELTPKRHYQRNMDAATIAHTYTIRPTLLNEFRWGFSGQRFPNVSAWDGQAVVQQLGFQGLAPNLPDVKGIPAVSFQRSGVADVNSPAACDPCGTNATHVFSNSLSWFRGRHDMKFGYSGRQGNYTDYRQDAALFGSFAYSGSMTGVDYADFLLGIPTSMSRAFPTVRLEQRRYVHGFFAQDSWKATPSLTLNLGLRWDVQMPFFDRANRLALFDGGTGKIVIPDGSMKLVSPLMPTGYIDVIEASKAGYPSKSLVNADYNNFQPRFGFAYRPWGNDTVIRGGFGIAYNQSPRGAAMGKTVPYVISEPTYTNDMTNLLVWPRVFPASGTRGPSTVSLPPAVVGNIKIARVIQYSLTVEHQRWGNGFQLSYNGTGTRGGVYQRNINQPLADGQLFINKPRLFPKYPAIYQYENGAGHQYHAFTAQVNRRMSRGFHYQTYFTWANDIMDYEDGGRGEDAYNRARDVGRESRQPKLRYSGNMIYELPVGRGKTFLRDAHWLANGILGGWRLSTIVALESGRPLTVQWRGPDPTGTAYTSGSNRPTVTIRPDVVGSFMLNQPDQYQWFAASGFDRPPTGRFGTAGPGILIGPPVKVMHNAVGKEFPIKEGAVVRFEILATNTLNHPNWADPNVRIDQSSVGTVSATINRNVKFDTGIPREVQLHLRVEW